MIFTTSKKELNRRKKAFTALLTSLLIGVILFSNQLDFHLFPIGYLLIFIIFLTLEIITFRFLDSLSQTKISVTDQEIERVNKDSTEKYLLSEIKSLKIKRRTNGVIREIYIVFHNRKHLYINAFEDEFEKLKNKIVGALKQNVKIREIREPLDFDQALFYPILGLLISFVGIFAFKKMLILDHFGVRILTLLFSVYIFSLGMYFILKKPISIRSGENQIITDYIFGISMIFFGVLFAIIGFRF